MNYIDCHLRQGRLQEAERVTRGTLAQIDHLGSNAQRYLPSVVYRLVRILLVNQAILVPTQVEGRVEMVQLWPIETAAQILEEMKRFLLNDVSRDTDTLERKLAYLMSIESDRLKATEFAEASGERVLSMIHSEVYCVFGDIAALSMIVAYASRGLPGLIDTRELIFHFLSNSEDENYVDWLIAKG